MLCEKCGKVMRFAWKDVNPGEEVPVMVCVCGHRVPAKFKQEIFIRK